MSSILYVDDSIFVNLRTAVIVIRCHLGKRYYTVDQRHIVGGLLYTLNVSGNGVSHVAEQLILQLVKLLLSTENCVLKLLKLIGSITFTACKCLFSDEIIRHHIPEGIGNLKAVPEYTVVLYFQRLDPGLFTFRGLKIREPLFTADTGILITVHFLMEALLYDTAVS